MSSIFVRARLRPAQLRTVADRRFQDARYLCDSRRNAHANGAMYLAGFVIECLLKAAILEAHPWLASAGSPQGRGPEETRLWNLCYRLHDLDELLFSLPTVVRRLTSLGPAGEMRLDWLHGMCASWTVFARYSPVMATIQEAIEFVDRVEELKKWLK